MHCLQHHQACSCLEKLEFYIDMREKVLPLKSITLKFNKDKQGRPSNIGGSQ